MLIVGQPVDAEFKWSCEQWQLFSFPAWKETSGSWTVIELDAVGGTEVLSAFLEGH